MIPLLYTRLTLEDSVFSKHGDGTRSQNTQTRHSPDPESRRSEAQAEMSDGIIEAAAFLDFVRDADKAEPLPSSSTLRGASLT